MIIQVDDTHRISTDERNWVIERRKSRAEGEGGEGKARTWRPEAYFPTAKMAVNELCRRLILAGDTQTLTDALDHIENVCNTLTAALEPEFDVTRKQNEHLH